MGWPHNHCIQDHPANRINVSVSVIFLTVKSFIVRLTASTPQSVCVRFKAHDGWLSCQIAVVICGASPI